jgi:2Fe-2S ferredoxin
METICFTLVEGNVQRKIETRPGEYRNLMVLLNDSAFLECFGECGGMGRCATCVVKIEGLRGRALITDRNEPVTLMKAGHTGEGVRLACQILVNEDLEGAVVELM